MITKEDVKYIASLSRMHLSEEEIALLTKNLEDILLYVALLKKADISRVQPTSHVFPLKNVFREDEPKPSLSQKDALQISTAKRDGFFEVPKVIE
ncbi:MAG: Asp-tRNA(Asn)/Glu-tRNA(Gln) amidotransferase subunit GatC [Candidatus Omnitrophota bacterium]